MRLRHVRAWLVRLGGLFGAGAGDRELAEELESHVQMHAEDYVRAGLTPQEARRRALVKLGGVEQTKESYRRQRGLPLIETLLQDLRYGLRRLIKNPVFTAVAVITLALGIGANTAIFSVVNAVLLRPLGYREPERLVLVKHKYQALGIEGEVSVPGYLDYKEQSQLFEGAAVYYSANLNLTNQGEAERLMARYVSAGFFPLLGAEAAHGRTFLQEEDQPGRNRVVVLSHGLWQRRFGGDPSLVGKTITLNGEGYQVIGLMPRSFQFGRDEVWVPIAFTPAQTAPATRGSEYVVMLARLRPGVSIGQAQAAMSALAARIQEQNPDSYPPEAGWGITLQSLHDSIVGDVRPALLVLLGAVGFLLLLACSNVANLLLARASARRREMAVRASLGAGRARLIRQLLTESVLLAFAGGGLGLLLSVWGVNFLVSLNAGTIPRSREIGVDARVLLFASAVSLVTGILFGLIPAFRASKVSLVETLKEGARGSEGGARLRSARSVLVVTQIAVALVLLVSAGLLVKSFSQLLEVNPGFQTEGVLTMQISLPGVRYDKAERGVAFYRQLTERLRALPGVESAGAVSSLPLAGPGMNSSFQIDGRPVGPNEQGPHGGVRFATPDYMRAMRIPLVRGRYFTERDAVNAPAVAIVDETLARRYFPNEEPVGKRVSWETDGNNQPRWCEIVGVVGEIKHVSLDAAPRGHLYFPHAQSASLSMHVVARSSAGEPASLAPALRAAVREIDPEQPVYNVRTMQEVFDLSVAQRRFSMLLLSIFACVALLLAAIGLYGVMAYMVTQRTHELGIRMALGAQRGDILRLVVGQGIVLGAVGVGVGLVGALVATRVMSSLLFGVTPVDPLTYAGVSLLLVAVTVLACYIPARRATKVNPMIALRYE